MFLYTSLLLLNMDAQYAYSFSVILNQFVISEFSHNSFFGLLLGRIFVLHLKITKDAT